MKIIDHQMGVFYFMEYENNLYLDVNCNKGPYGFSIFVQLTEIEVESYRVNGVEAIESLALSIMNGPDSMAERNIKDRALLDKAYLAIMTFRK